MASDHKDIGGDNHGITRRDRPADPRPAPARGPTDRRRAWPPGRAVAATASARVQRLEKTGVITGYRAIVDPAKLGLGITAHIRLRTSHAQLEQALALAARTPDITAIRRVTGEDCLLCDVHCSDARRLETIIDSLARFGAVTTALVLHDYSERALTPAEQ